MMPSAHLSCVLIPRAGPCVGKKPGVRRMSKHYDKAAPVLLWLRWRELSCRCVPFLLYLLYPERDLNQAVPWAGCTA